MQDLLYLVVTATFFASMAAFVRGCERIIGRDVDVADAVDDNDLGSNLEARS